MGAVWLKCQNAIKALIQIDGFEVDCKMVERRCVPPQLGDPILDKHEHTKGAAAALRTLYPCLAGWESHFNRLTCPDKYVDIFECISVVIPVYRCI